MLLLLIVDHLFLALLKLDPEGAYLLIGHLELRRAVILVFDYLANDSTGCIVLVQGMSQLFPRIVKVLSQIVNFEHTCIPLGLHDVQQVWDTVCNEWLWQTRVLHLDIDQISLKVQIYSGNGTLACVLYMLCYDLLLKNVPRLD